MNKGRHVYYIQVFLFYWFEFDGLRVTAEKALLIAAAVEAFPMFTLRFTRQTVSYRVGRFRFHKKTFRKLFGKPKQSRQTYRCWHLAVSFCCDTRVVHVIGPPSLPSYVCYYWWRRRTAFNGVQHSAMRLIAFFAWPRHVYFLIARLKSREVATEQYIRRLTAYGLSRYTAWQYNNRRISFSLRRTFPHSPNRPILFSTCEFV